MPVEPQKPLQLRFVPAGTCLVRYAVQCGMELDSDAVVICNLSDFEEKYREWQASLPSVHPFYAIKCNPLSLLLETALGLGSGFDCASPKEIQEVLSVGGSPENIIFANPMSSAAAIKAAAALGVTLFTFDSECGLRRMLTCTDGSQDIRYVLRILPPTGGATVSSCSLGGKYGVDYSEALRLINMCKRFGANLVGFSFHTGSGCGSASIYASSLRLVAALASRAAALGFTLSILDIGGGFTTAKMATQLSVSNRKHGILIPRFEDTATVITAELPAALRHFTVENVRVIAEPGRFLASDTMTLAVRIYGRRLVFQDVCVDKTEDEMLAAEFLPSEVKYYVGDGCYGFFINTYFGHVVPHIHIRRADGSSIDYENGSHAPGSILSNVFGPTCDGMDIILEDCWLPMLEVGSWIVCEGFGAYTYSGLTGFNGIQPPQIIPVRIQRETEEKIHAYQLDERPRACS